MHKQIQFTISSMAPLLMHNGQLANPLHPISKAMKKITDKRTKKTDTDLEELARLEFTGSLYLNDDQAPVVPGELLEAMMVEAGKAVRLGKQFKAGLLSEGNWPLIYDGPKTQDSLWEDIRFRDQRGARITTARVIRTRPRFDKWSLKFTLHYLPTVLNEAAVRDALIHAGQLIGLGDYRPRFGRFEVVG
jgi:hypothetical protein